MKESREREDERRALSRYLLAWHLTSVSFPGSRRRDTGDSISRSVQVEAQVNYAGEVIN